MIPALAIIVLLVLAAAGAVSLIRSIPHGLLGGGQAAVND